MQLALEQEDGHVLLFPRRAADSQAEYIAALLVEGGWPAQTLSRAVRTARWTTQISVSNSEETRGSVAPEDDWGYDSGGPLGVVSLEDKEGQWGMLSAEAVAEALSACPRTLWSSN